jgi:hypothetical protein
MCQITIGTEADEIQIDDFNNGKKKLFFGSTLLYNNMKTLVTFVGAADNVIAHIITIIENIAKKQNKTKQNMLLHNLSINVIIRSSTYNLLKPGTQYSLICIQQEQQDLRMS